MTPASVLPEWTLPPAPMVAMARAADGGVLSSSEPTACSAAPVGFVC